MGHLPIVGHIEPELQRFSELAPGHGRGRRARGGGVGFGYGAPMQVDGGIGFDPGDAVNTAQRAEDDGFDGLWCAETGHDPFLPLLLAAEHTDASSSARGSRSPSPATP